MKLTIDITRQDYQDFNVHVFMKTRLLKTSALGLLGLFVLLFSIGQKQAGNWVGLLVPTVLYLIFYSGFIFLSLYSTRRLPKENGAVLGKKELELTEEALLFADIDSKGQYNWSAFFSMQESKKAFYLYLEKNMAVVVPKRCFESEKQVEDFRKLVKDRLPLA